MQNMVDVYLDDFFFNRGTLNYGTCTEIYRYLATPSSVLSIISQKLLVQCSTEDMTNNFPSYVNIADKMTRDSAGTDTKVVFRNLQ